VHRANGPGALVGVVYGMTAAIFIAFWDVLTGRPTLSYQWIGFLSLVTSVGVGWIACFFFDKHRGDRKSVWYVSGAFLLLAGLSYQILSWARVE